MKQKIKMSISSKISNIELKLDQMAQEIERERAETNLENTSAIIQDLLDEKNILEQQLLELQTNLVLGESLDSSTIDVYKTFTVDIDGQVRTISIVPLPEVDPTQGKISLDCPLARALVGHNKDELVEVQTPTGMKNYRIVGVK